MIVYKDIIQGSEAWERIRLGRPTASQFKRFITAKEGELSRSKDKKSLSQGAMTYLAELIAETFVPNFKSFPGTAWTERGTEMEPEAREAFTKHTGLKLTQVGFCTRDKEGCSPGCSPDSLIADDAGNWIAGLEMKAPAPDTHIGYIIDGVLPDDYTRQVHGSMAVTGLNEWHFWSYYPGLQPFHLVIKRNKYTEQVNAALSEFIDHYARIWDEVIPKIKIKPELAE